MPRSQLEAIHRTLGSILGLEAQPVHALNRSARLRFLLRLMEVNLMMPTPYLEDHKNKIRLRWPAAAGVRTNLFPTKYVV